MEVKLGVDEADIYEAQWRRIAYGSVTPFAVLQSRKNSISDAYNSETANCVYRCCLNLSIKM